MSRRRNMDVDTMAARARHGSDKGLDVPKTCGCTKTLTCPRHRAPPPVPDLGPIERAALHELGRNPIMGRLWRVREQAFERLLKRKLIKRVVPANRRLPHRAVLTPKGVVVLAQIQGSKAPTRTFLVAIDDAIEHPINAHVVDHCKDGNQAARYVADLCDFGDTLHESLTDAGRWTIATADGHRVAAWPQPDPAAPHRCDDDNCNGVHLGAGPQGEHTWCPDAPPTKSDTKADAKARARQLVRSVNWTSAMRRCLLRKSWVPGSHSGGETLLAERMTKMGLFAHDPGDTEYTRTSLGDAVVAIIHDVAVAQATKGDLPDVDVCPFCGDEHPTLVLDEAHPMMEGLHHVTCVVCGARGPAAHDDDEGSARYHAIVGWNDAHRVRAARRRKAVRS